MTDLSISAILRTPRPIEASFAALFPVESRATYRVYITGGGATPGLHQSMTVQARSVGEAIDQVIEEAGATDVDGSHWTITAERLPGEPRVDVQPDDRGTMNSMLDDWAMEILGNAVPGATVTVTRGLRVQHWTLASATGTAYVDVTDAEMDKLGTDGLPVLLVTKWMAFAREGTELWDALDNAKTDISREVGLRRAARYGLRSLADGSMEA